MDTLGIVKNLESLSIENTWLKKMLKFLTKDTGLIFWNKTFYANCSDLFFWGCADAEEITDKTFDVLEKSINDTGYDRCAGIWLYCCRIRKMRPQGAAYKYIEKEYWKFFDECGPERKSEFGNPEDRPADDATFT